jgi:hypothetical protein
MGSPRGNAELSRPRSSALRRYWPRTLFLLPVVAALWVGSYDRVEPTLFGVPFFYWYQLALVLLGAIVVAVVYRLERAGGSEP